ncbi:unnamed protein product [Paramecium sonneborni]|uniref:Uncharacterized protein n=1 Tax=Paramecium sonneborni TaxID=65129 RepID=A0A8S1R1H1_9CILI|nr:unnamed protein product [Paramecium sonneborni]
MLQNDIEIFNEFKQYCQLVTVNEIDDKIFSDNFDSFFQLCLNRIASKNQCIYEQIAIICNQIKTDTQKLSPFYHLSSNEQTKLPHMIQITYNMAADKLQINTYSKISNSNIIAKTKQLEYQN